MSEDVGPHENQMESHRATKILSNQVHRLPQLKKYLQGVSNTRSSPYIYKIALIVHWNGTVGVIKHMYTMQRVMEEFDIHCEHHTLCDTRDGVPESNLLRRIDEIIKDCQDRDGKCLVVFCYLGHAEKEGHLSLTSDLWDQKFFWPSIRMDLLCEETHMDKIDTLAILDCYYDELAWITRSPRKVLVIAAGGNDKNRHTEESHHPSFPERLYRVVQKFKGKGSITTIDLYHELVHDAVGEEPNNHVCSDTVPRPVMMQHEGTKPIKLVFKDLHRSLRSTPEEGIVVKLTLKGDSQAMRLLRDAVREIPDKLDVEITHAFHTG
ncbi:uncharacterized protein N7506_002879 [Penicillium brevicompactum]|uniref:uncharacterized protein n=1 Tax=Penicillium brevicompactum TaxID=5074 RepID=UPI002541797C|nr:uncharacterized protein N7506_002879 [Penicillium brevicompactum]KAJ5343055.1 hypothetical protein N7506_002879 [Penicillium brevicompactum]